MAYIFMDESGDLGFDFTKKRTSKYFVVTMLFSASKRPIEKVVKKTFLSLTPKVIQKHSGCLHATKEKPKTRIKLLQLLSNLDISVITIYLNKQKVYTRLQDEQHVLYNYVTNILLDRVYTKKLIPLDDPIYLIASQRETNKFLNLNFQTYLKKQVQHKHKLDIQIQITPAHSEKCLQAVDFVCWSMFRKIQYRDDSYAKYIQKIIVEESSLFG